MQNAEGSGVRGLFSRALRVVLWTGGILVLAFIAFVIYRIPAVQQQQKSKETVALIQSQHITLADVDGKHLPPPPDPKLVDATVAGIDANQNGIRDDVELAIFKKYPNSPYTRAAELQYAAGLQMMITRVSDSETWKAAATANSRGYACISETFPRGDLQVYMKVTDNRVKEVEDLEFNTDQREEARTKANSYETSFSLADSDYCDVNAKDLPY